MVICKPTYLSILSYCFIKMRYPAAVVLSRFSPARQELWPTDIHIYSTIYKPTNNLIYARLCSCKTPVSSNKLFHFIFPTSVSLSLSSNLYILSSNLYIPSCWGIFDQLPALLVLIYRSQASTTASGPIPYGSGTMATRNWQSSEFMTSYGPQKQAGLQPFTLECFITSWLWGY